MMLALLEANPTAFYGNNINALNAGATLDIPSMDAIKKLSKSAATTAVAQQNSNWKNRNKKMVEVEAVEVSDVPMPIVGVEDNAVDGQADTDFEDTTDSLSLDMANEEPAARLKLVVPSDETSLNDDMLSPQGDDELAELSEQLTFAQETIEAQAQENIDFKARMQAMEEQLETMRRILSLKDPELARLQSMLQKEQDSESVDGNTQAIVDEALAVLEQSPDELEPAMAVEDELEIDNNTAEENIKEYLNSLNSDQDVDVVAEDSVDEPVIESAASEINTDENEEESVLPTVDEMVATTSQLLNVDEAEIQDVISQVQKYVAENKMTTMLGSLLVLLAIWLIIRRRNRPGVSWDEAVGKYDISDDLSSVNIAATGDNADGEAVVVDEAEEQQEIVDEKTADDLIKQADMFVGYADYTQAKTSLEQARLLEPDNLRVISKMCFVLYKQQNVDDFIALVRQSDFDSASAEWTDIVAWGKELAPENTLFAGDEVLEEEETILTSESEEELPTNEAGVDDLSKQSEHIEFNLDDFKVDDSEVVDEGQQQEAETVSDDAPVSLNSDNNSTLETSSDFDAPLSFDIENSKGDEQESLDESTLSLDTDDIDDSSLEFESLDLDEAVSDDAAEQEALASLAEEELEATSTEESNSPVVEFDVDEIDEIDEAETKLDLAVAYIDMGDPDGAKSILEEVQSEGTDDQKNRAQKILDDLS